MAHVKRIAIDRVEDNPEHEERRSEWTGLMYREMTKTVRKARMVRIIVEKEGEKYRVVVGHHLLKAARECGLREVYAHVVDKAAKRGEGSLEEALRSFRSGIEETLHRAAARPDAGDPPVRLSPPSRSSHPRAPRRPQKTKTR